MAFTLLFRESKLCPVTLLQLDLTNPRLQTGTDIAVKDDSELIAVLCDIAALDELVTSICTNTYLNLEPMIVIGKSDSGPFRDIVITKVPFIMTPFRINGVTSYEAKHLGAQRYLYGDGGIDWASDCFDCMASAAARDG